MRRIILVALLCVFGTVALAELSEKIQKKLDLAEANYKAAVDKADNARFYAVQRASTERVKALKLALTEVTKAGDFDSATLLKERIAAAEAQGGVRGKPKNVVTLGGHSYALVPDKCTWHIAKKSCEEMGGHLVCIESPEEEQFVLKLCGTQTQSVWLGATDEEVEDQWHWVSGLPLNEAYKPRWNLTNEGDVHHYLCYYAPGFGDSDGGTRLIYLCEWEK